MVKYLSKLFTKRLYLKLIIFGLLVQIISLFRNYPSNHPCGRVLDINSAMSVLINCDSAVYMKDAQNPVRLVNGESVYQDRPLPTLLVATLSKFWHFLNLPDYYRDVQGNSGQIVTYSLITYVIFLALSAAIFSFNRDEVSIGLVEISLWPHRFMIATGLTVLTFQSVVSGLDLLLNGKHPFAPDQAIELAQAVRQQTL